MRRSAGLCAGGNALTGHRLPSRDRAVFLCAAASTNELAAAATWAGEQFSAYFEGLPSDFERAERLVAVGGTVTTLVALVHELEPYDSNFVHLRELSMEQISAAIDRMSTLDVEGIAALPGVQPKRAGVLLAGAW